MLALARRHDNQHRVNRYVSFVSPHAPRPTGHGHCRLHRRHAPLPIFASTCLDSGATSNRLHGPRIATAPERRTLANTASRHYRFSSTDEAPPKRTYHAVTLLIAHTHTSSRASRCVCCRTRCGSTICTDSAPYQPSHTALEPHSRTRICTRG